MNNCRNPCLYTFFYAIGEREERVACHNRALCFFACVRYRLLCRPNTVGLSHTDTRRSVRFTNYDCVRFRMLYHFPVKKHCLHFFVRRRAFGHYFQIFRRKQRIVVILHEQSAVHFLHIVRARFALCLDIGQLQKTDILFRLQNFKRAVCKRFRDNDFDENLVDFRCRCFIHRTVNCQNTAKYRNGIGFISLDIRFVNGFARTHTARICVLASHHAGFIELFYKLQRPVCIVDIIIGQFLTPKLFCLRKRACADKFFAVIACALMGIFAIAHILRLFVCERNTVRETDIELLSQIIRNHAIVYGRMCKYFVL